MSLVGQKMTSSPYCTPSLERREKNYEVVDQQYSEAFNMAETSEEPAIVAGRTSQST
jgi:hypothetical protein